MVATHTAMQQLELVREAKIFDILDGSLDPRLEASGVLAKDGLFYVIFDNLPHIACIGPGASPGGRGQSHDRAGEGPPPRLRGHRVRPVARPLLRADRIAAPSAAPTFMAAVQEYDADFRYIGSAWLDFPLDRPNKGLEGLTCVRRDWADLPARAVRGQQVQRRRGGPHPRRRADPGVPARPPQLGPRRQDPAAGNGAVRGLQRHRRDRQTGSR